jgi:hypothetical protein
MDFSGPVSTQNFGIRENSAPQAKTAHEHTIQCTNVSSQLLLKCVRTAQNILWSIKRTITSRDKDIIRSLYVYLLRPHLENLISLTIISDIIFDIENFSVFFHSHHELYNYLGLCRQILVFEEH